METCSFSLPTSIPVANGSRTGSVFIVISVRGLCFETSGARPSQRRTNLPNGKHSLAKHNQCRRTGTNLTREQPLRVHQRGIRPHCTESSKHLSHYTVHGCTAPKFLGRLSPGFDSADASRNHPLPRQAAERAPAEGGPARRSPTGRR